MRKKKIPSRRVNLLFRKYNKSKISSTFLYSIIQVPTLNKSHMQSRKQCTGLLYKMLCTPGSLCAEGSAWAAALFLCIAPGVSIHLDTVPQKPKCLMSHGRLLVEPGKALRYPGSCFSILSLAQALLQAFNPASFAVLMLSLLCSSKAGYGALNNPRSWQRISSGW